MGDVLRTLLAQVEISESLATGLKSSSESSALEILDVAKSSI